MTQRIIGRQTLRQKVPYSDVHIWRLERQKKFPKRITLGPNSVGWIEDEVDDWLQSKIDERDAKNQAPPETPDKNKNRGRGT